MTMRVSEAMKGDNPIVSPETNIKDAIVKMTEFGFGAIVIADADSQVKGVFTDGDLRRYLQTEGPAFLDKNLGDLNYGSPVSIEGGLLLNDAASLFKKTSVDTILVTDNGKPIGMLDIQDLKAN